MTITRRELLERLGSGALILGGVGLGLGVWQPDEALAKKKNKSKDKKKTAVKKKRKRNEAGPLDPGEIVNGTTPSNPLLGVGSVTVPTTRQPLLPEPTPTSDTTTGVRAVPGTGAVFAPSNTTTSGGTTPAVPGVSRR
ncbi:MAG: hypothetical protein U0821_12050 [Chloroflexota bacterium]